MVVSLWVLAVLAVFAVTLGYHVRQKVTLSERLGLRSILYGIAETGIQRALIEIQKPDASEGWDTLADSWSTHEEIFKEIEAGNGTSTVFYEYWDDQEGVMKIRYGVQDEESKVNLNFAPSDIISRILQIQAGLGDEEANQIAYAVVDWRDADSFMAHPDGAEDDYYEDEKYPYEAKDAPFQVLQEFMLVRGMTPEIFEKVKDKVTVYGSGAININTASRQVLLATGLGEKLVQYIQTYRRGTDRVEGTVDDQAFTQATAIVSTLTAAFGGLPGGEVATLNNLVTKGIFTTASNVFRIRSQGLLPQGEALDIIAVADRTAHILYWSAGIPYRLPKPSVRKIN